MQIESTEKEDGEVGHGQWEKVTVGSCMHRRVANDNGTDGHVTDNTLKRNRRNN